MRPLRLVPMLALATAAHAQSLDAARFTEPLTRWITLVAPPGSEELAAPSLTKAFPGWSRDALGNYVKRVGSGSPRRVVACGLDAPAYVVSQITDDGYIRLHRIGTPLQHPLADQAMEATLVQIATASARVPGVVAINNGHFARQHRGDTTVVTVDQLWVDVGASSKADVARLGIALLDPVIPDRPRWSYANYAAGPSAGSRAGCAAVAALSNVPVPTGEVIYILSAAHVFNWSGLVGAMARLGKVDDVVIVDPATRAPRELPRARLVSPKVRFAGSMVESITASDARTALFAAADAAGIPIPGDMGLTPPAEISPARIPARTDAYGIAEKEVMTLLDIAGVPGHEWRVRNAVRAALPDWAKKVAVVDSAGNLIVAVGPERDSVAFVAHTDEVAYTLERILPDGQVTLTRQGGVIPSAWEGQPAILAFDPDAQGNTAETLHGVFVPRDSARVKTPPRLTAWFGLDSAALVARGVRPGAAILGFKRATRLAGTRVTGRSSDDRTGSAALILAVRALDPKLLKRRAIFVWTMGEESGLVGARAFGVAKGTGLARVYAVDTFVSSDTPLEQHTFAYAPLGAGAVLRGLDDGTVASRAERDRVLRVAKARGIPLQLGTTHGSTDGSALGTFGAPNLGLSWPGRYSHTPGEVLDLRDLDALARLITAMAVTP